VRQDHEARRGGANEQYSFVSYPSAKASELPDSTTILDPFHPKSCPLPLGRSVTEVSISTGVYSDRTDPTVNNSMWTDKLFHRGKSVYLIAKAIEIYSFPQNP